MLEPLGSEVSTWCENNVSLDIAGQLDQGQSPLPLYKAMTEKGWLDYADIREDPDNLYRLAEVCKITNSYSGVLGNMISVNAACAIMLGSCGGAEHQQLASDILAGGKLAAFALTEPQAGTDVRGLETEAYLAGDHWEVSGEKYLTTGAKVADVLLVVARTNSQAPMNRGTSLLAIPRDASGLNIKSLPKMAANGYASCHVVLDRVAVPEDAVVGDPNAAW
ncbi:MAG: acyl-CoA dehydrogenase, partial [Haliea sp.]